MESGEKDKHSKNLDILWCWSDEPRLDGKHKKKKASFEVFGRWENVTPGLRAHTRRTLGGSKENKKKRARAGSHGVFGQEFCDADKFQLNLIHSIAPPLPHTHLMHFPPTSILFLYVILSFWKAY